MKTKYPGMIGILVALILVVGMVGCNPVLFQGEQGEKGEVDYNEVEDMIEDAIADYFDEYIEDEFDGDLEDYIDDLVKDECDCEDGEDGADGEQGPAGPQGEQGIQGPPGECPECELCECIQQCAADNTDYCKYGNNNDFRDCVEDCVGAE